MSDAVLILLLLVLVVAVPTAAAHISIQMKETADEVDRWLEE